MPTHNTKQRTRKNQCEKKEKTRKRLENQRGIKNARHQQRKTHRTRKKMPFQLKHFIREEADGVYDVHEKSLNDLVTELDDCACCRAHNENMRGSTGFRWEQIRKHNSVTQDILDKIISALAMEDTCHCRCPCHQKKDYLQTIKAICVGMSDVDMILSKDDFSLPENNFVLWQNRTDKKNVLLEIYSRTNDLDYIYNLIEDVSRAQKLKKEGWDLDARNILYAYANGWSSNMPDWKFVLINTCQEDRERVWDFETVSIFLEGPKLNAVRAFKDMEQHGFMNDDQW